MTIYDFFRSGITAAKTLVNEQTTLNLKLAVSSYPAIQSGCSDVELE